MVQRRDGSHDGSLPIRNRCLLVIAIALAGCGKDTGPEHHPVSGVVKYKGEPVTEGSVQFSNPEFGSGSGQLGEGGAYEIEGGLVAGSYKVMIVAPTPNTVPDASNPQGAMRKAPEAKNIPRKYRNASTSGFTAEVVAGENTFPFEME